MKTGDTVLVRMRVAEGNNEEYPHAVLVRPDWPSDVRQEVVFVPIQHVEPLHEEDLSKGRIDGLDRPYLYAELGGAEGASTVDQADADPVDVLADRMGQLERRIDELVSPRSRAISDVMDCAEIGPRTIALVVRPVNDQIRASRG